MQGKRKQVKAFKIQEVGMEGSNLISETAIGMSVREIKNSRILEVMSETYQRERKERDAKVLALISKKE